MSLLPDWKDVLKRAWSVKFMALAAVVSGIETVLQIMEPAWSASMPKGLFAGLTGIFTSTGIVVRLLAQQEASHGTDTQK